MIIMMELGLCGYIFGKLYDNSKAGLIVFSPFWGAGGELLVDQHILNRAL